VPGTEVTRSFSMANTSSKTSGQLEFVIKVYPDGLFSHFLDSVVAVGDRLDVVGPFGSTFLMPEDPDADLLMICTGTGVSPLRKNKLAVLSCI